MTWTELWIARLVYSEMYTKHTCILFCSLLQSSIRYAFFLSPWGSKITSAYNNLMLRFFGNALGMIVWVSQIPLLLALFYIDSREFRRQAFASRFCWGMINRSKDESDMSGRARSSSVNFASGYEVRSLEDFEATWMGTLQLYGSH